MANLLDYLYWRGDLSFDRLPMNEVDHLALCRLSYIPFDGAAPDGFKKDGVALSQAAGVVQAKETRGETSYFHSRDGELLRLMAESVRFGKMRLSGYRNIWNEEAQQQFSAVCIEMENGNCYLSYRGTDQTLVGWKEDFNMAFSLNVPAQVNAKNYLEEAAQFFEGNFFAGGHSKGGNLAVYAAMFADKDAQSRIKGVYNMDGPGFNEQVMALENYAKVAGRVHTYLPQSSVVGMLLEHSEDFSVVQSDAASLAQHDIYSWQVEPSGFVLAQGLTNASLFIDSAMKNWVAAMQPTQREKLIDGIYEILSSTDVRTLRELLSGKSTFTILRHVSKMDAQKRQVILDALRMLAKSLKKTLPEFLGMISGG